MPRPPRSPARGPVRSALARLVSLALVLGLTLAGSAAAGPLNSGIALANPLTTGMTAVDLDPADELAYHRVAEAGASLTRVIAYWSAIAPAEEPQAWTPEDPAHGAYDFSSLDEQVRMAADAGLEPLIMVHTAPRWAERCDQGQGSICDPDPADLAAFATALATRYSGGYEGLPRVRYWMPWNEPNLFLFYMPQFDRSGKPVSPYLYRSLLNAFHDAVKAVDRTNRVVAGGLAPLRRPGGLGPLDFMRRLLCMKGRAKPVRRPGCKGTARLDIWATNPYTTGGPTHHAAGPDDVSLGDLPELKRLIEAADRSRRIVNRSRSTPLWVTEFSWDTKAPDPGGLPMGIHARWTAEAMYRAWDAGVSSFFWLSLRDWPREKGMPYSESIESGLYFRGRTLARDRPKRSLTAFRFPFVAFREGSGISYWGRTPTSRPGLVELLYSRGGKQRLEVVRADRFGIFEGRVETPLGRGGKGSVSARFGGDASLPFSLTPVRDFYQPPFGKSRP